MADKKIIILTGEIQSGKTKTLSNWVKDRKDVAGILTPVINGRRLFYTIPAAEYYNMEAEGEEDVLLVGRFRFSATQFEKTNVSILKWMKEMEWNYIIIDEIGPLEIVQKKGLWPSMFNLLKNDFPQTIILVVRKSLTAQLKNIMKENGITFITTSPHEFEGVVAGEISDLKS